MTVNISFSNVELWSIDYIIVLLECNHHLTSWTVTLAVTLGVTVKVADFCGCDSVTVLFRNLFMDGGGI